MPRKTESVRIGATKKKKKKKSQNLFLCPAVLLLDMKNVNSPMPDGNVVQCETTNMGLEEAVGAGCRIPIQNWYRKND